MEQIALLGSTGSIGTSSIEVIKRHLDKFEFFLLTADKNSSLLLKQCKELNPKYVFINDVKASIKFKSDLNSLSLNTCLVDSEEELLSLIANTKLDTIIAGMSGVVGLKYVYRAVQFGKKVLLANKESYIVAGELLNNSAIQNGAIIFPLDSEHSAIHQCISNQNNCSNDINKLYITGSGGPFLDKDLSQFKSITPEQAIAHPIWKMGKKISVDSATLMNKGLEIIEARWLFNIDSRDIEVVIHPEGIIHSMVEYCDSSVIAQLSIPDMKVPIAYGLGYPERIESGIQKLDFINLQPLTFREVDLLKFPSINIARHAIEQGGTSPTILNAVNEESVKSFLDNEIEFLQIMEIISYVMDKITNNPVKDLEDIFEADFLARNETRNRINFLNGSN